jgi:hypothetical protein
MTLITTPRGTNEVCFEHASSSGFMADEVYRNPGWNYHSQMMPGAATVIKDIVRGAKDAMIAALEGQAEPQLIVQVRKLLPELPIEDYHQLYLVFRNGQFLETYDHTRQYKPHDTVHLPESTFGGVVTMDYGQNFANVIGSTNDPRINGLSWIQLWTNSVRLGYPTVCTSQGYNNFPCSNYLVGGHVIIGNQARIVAAGSNDVYIYPICSPHNNNDGVSMAALMYTKDVWLKNYMGS